MWRPVEIDEIKVVVATLVNDGWPPRRLGITHWSARVMATELGISLASVARIWREWHLEPDRIEAFKFSTDPEPEAKIRDVVGLYLAPPDNAVMVCADEKSQIQPPDGTAPPLSLRPGLPARPPAGPMTTPGTAPIPCSPPLRPPPGRSLPTRATAGPHQEFLKFLTR
jgi:hypothetical protein